MIYVARVVGVIVLAHHHANRVAHLADLHESKSGGDEEAGSEKHHDEPWQLLGELPDVLVSEVYEGFHGRG